ncbi:hypothetical protein H5410_024886 [Solanum commersonii]|uniref:catalase n=1 Tax=Solanum commersonii TaxID=4109 RepID=A0A9J5ZN58_SOLCO|nr:hypothetical protein H5410_024886 [Solanum commersonii]
MSSNGWKENLPQNDTGHASHACHTHLPLIEHLIIETSVTTPDTLMDDNTLAFFSAIVVPDIYYSDDKYFPDWDILILCLEPNYLQPPFNAPTCGCHYNHHEGFMNFMYPNEEYSNGAYVDCSNSFDVLTGCCTISCQGLVLVVMQRIKQFLLALTTKHDKCIIEKENNFKQPGERYRSWAPGQLVWYIGYLLVLLLQARKKDLPAV